MANPETGRRDVDTLAALRAWEHQDFGVYAAVTSGGTLRPATRWRSSREAPLPRGRARGGGYRGGTGAFPGPAEFVKGVVAMSGLPPADRVEVCFAGRSNVGKSSLINALTARRSLARASNTPGRTQEMNYFALSDSHYLVDLPGYGYANAPKEVVAKWQALLRAYLGGRTTLRRAFVLIDARHGAKAVDEEIFALLDKAAVPFQIVLTKADKIRDSEVETVLDQVRDARGSTRPPIPSFSSPRPRKGEGSTTSARSSPGSEPTTHARQTCWAPLISISVPEM